jgi:DNA-binding transcriptional MerR regulator
MQRGAHRRCSPGLDLQAHFKVYAAAMNRRISDLAAQAGLSAATVRYYEHLGLLPAPARTAAGYRNHDDEALDRLRFIKGAQQVGLRLREIGELLTIRDRGLCPCGHPAQLLRQRMAEVAEEVARLGEVRAELARMLAQYPDQPSQDPASGLWWCEQQFTREGR